MKKFHKTVALNIERENLSDVISRLDIQSAKFFASRIADISYNNLNEENR